jgi:hypothetical protein
MCVGEQLHKQAGIELLKEIHGALLLLTFQQKMNQWASMVPLFSCFSHSIFHVDFQRGKTGQSTESKYSRAIPCAGDQKMQRALAFSGCHKDLKQCTMPVENGKGKRRNGGRRKTAMGRKELMGSGVLGQQPVPCCLS